uniref:HNH endonuclease n=1 Tax=Siphoviridae sp. ctgn638 TaxID=2827913 RepID=A0A8S5TL60_9CAUD|nr:MAG TPA: HNH endonuclease [Siphoviridae sp. ctgn638]
MKNPTPFYLTMAREFSKSFYNSKQWKQTRKSYILSKFGICERCGKPNSKQVHHKVYLTPENINNPNVSLNFDNLELLCDVCHQKEHFEKYSPTLYGLKFDENGQLVKVQS